MGEYEPRDSRNVTLKQNRAPGEPPRTGPMEEEARRQAMQSEAERGELYEDERGEDAEATIAQEESQQAQREEAMERDAEELDDDLDRND
jgi:hypothetical protein